MGGVFFCSVTLHPCHVVACKLGAEPALANHVDACKLAYF